MVVNLSTVVVIYFLANLAPVLLSKAQLAQAANPDDTVPKMLTFMAKVFDTLLPSLSLFQVSHPLVSDMPLPMGSLFFYIGKVIAYGLIYTFIVLLAGLILFEDRDLA
jgi:hypothetical protein